MNTDEASVVPDRFSASIGGFMGESYSVEFRDGTLTHTMTGLHYSSPEHTPIRPTEAQWREFRRALDALNVWQWPDDYPNPGVLDGSLWSFDISYSDRAVTTHGDNNYPDANGKPTNDPDPTKTFNRFLRTIRKLTGRNFE